MRTVRRPKVELPTLSKGGKGDEQAEANLEAKKKDPSVKLSFNAKDYWNKPDVRGALYAMHGWVCAYCSCALPRNDRGDVEHFRPKKKVKENPAHSGYWWLAYVFENYVISCRVCNAYRKGSKFPLRPNGKHRTYEKRKSLSKEPRLLLDPAVDPIDDLLDVDWHDELCPIRAIPGISSIHRRQVKGTLAFFAMNTDPELVKERREVCDAVVDALVKGDDASAKRAAIRYSPHSLVALRILQSKKPSAIPRPEQELDWLIEALAAKLLLALKLLEEIVDPKEKEKHSEKIKEILFSLAVLWKDPPVGAPADVEAKLDSLGLTAHVRPKYEELGLKI